MVAADLQCGFGAQVGVSYFPVRHSARLHGDHFVSFPDSCVSLPRIYLGVQFLGLLTRRGLGGLSVPLLALPGFCHLRWSRQSDPDASCDRLSVAVSLSPSLTNALTPCHCGPLGGLSSWLAPYLIPPWVVKLSLPALDASCA